MLIKLLTQNMDAEFYVKILTEKFNEIMSIGGKKWELQSEYDPKYKSKLAQEYFKKAENIYSWMASILSRS